MRTKSIITENSSYCALCGRPCSTEHHLLFGSGIRKLAEEDGIKMNVCNECHTMNSVPDRIHDNPMAEKLSKMLGQAIFERNKCAEGATLNEAREMFRRRYGFSKW